MTHTTNLNRRKLVAVLPLAAVFTSPIPVASAGVTSSTSSREFVRDVIFNHRSARAIAESFARQASSSDVAKLVAHLSEGLTTQVHRTARRDPRTIAQTLIAADYEKGQTVSLEGWLLSKSEVALCVVASLNSGIK